MVGSKLVQAKDIKQTEVFSDIIMGSWRDRRGVATAVFIDML